MGPTASRAGSPVRNPVITFVAAMHRVWPGHRRVLLGRPPLIRLHTVDTPAIDALDRVILDELRHDGRLTWRELGQRIGLGPTATADRVHRLEQIGVLTGYRADVDLSALGLGLRAITELSLSRDTDPAAFEAELLATPEVQSAMHVTGVMDYVLLLACPDVPTLDRLLTHWKSDAGVEESSTRILLRDVE
jgi:Lrp/AsnC family transcriptional regulator, leucine-responsive regulatory protein